MKMNWGKGIIFIYAVFIAGIGFMVYTSMTKDTELVTKNYYEKELKYQEQINKINNSNGLNKKIKIETMPNRLVIIFPDDILSNSINGEVSFYRPSDSKKDFSIPVKVSKNSEQEVNTEQLPRGLWKVMVNWNSGGVNFYNEEKVMIQ
jgi:hypothetical protein